MIPSIKIYGNNLTLAHQLMETAFTLMRNEGQSPAETMAAACESLTAGIDISDADRTAVLNIMRDIIGKHSRKIPLTVLVRKAGKKHAH